MVSIYLRLTAVVSTAFGFSLLGTMAPAQAVLSSPLSGQLLVLENQRFSFIPPEDSGQPQTNRAGGRRDQFCNNSTPTPALSLLTPPTHQGTTVAAHPTFLAYLPQTSAKQAFLKLEDEDNNYLYHTTFDLPAGAGIISFRMPDTAPVLEVDKYYKVSLAMICGQVLDPNDPVVEGWVKRIELDSWPDSLSLQEPSLELGAWYASHGVWFDALSTLAELRRSEPDHRDAIAAWEELLRSVNLDMLDNATLLSYVD